jgi:hypothetical protein
MLFERGNPSLLKLLPREALFPVASQQNHFTPAMVVFYEAAASYASGETHCNPYVIEFLRTEQVNLLVFDPQTEEVVQWIKWNDIETSSSDS